jgi:hypothetical protein
MDRSYRIVPGLLVAALVLTTIVATGRTGARGLQGTPVAATPAATPGVSARQPAWIELGPDGAYVARTITAGVGCPDVALDGAAAPMQLRTAADAAFPVTVCEAPVPATAGTVEVAGQPLRLPQGTPRRIAVIGDTGCRLNVYDGFQACNDPAAWPFARIAASVAAWQPDLIIHVGDYLYREQACPAGNAGCAGSPFGDNWETWNADFFAPAAALLPVAPWLVVRGNHEVCARNGEGWFRFLDPRPYPAACADYTDPYAVAVGGHQFLVLDSATAEDQKAPADEVAIYTEQFKTLGQVARPGAWFVTHKPLSSIIEERAGVQTEVHNETLQAAFAQAFPAGVQLALAGHIHLAEVLSFDPASGRPLQFVVGNGGTSLDVNVTDALPNADVPDSQLTAGETLEQFGFLTFEPDAAGNLVATERDVDGAVTSTCTVVASTATCRR